MSNSIKIYTNITQKTMYMLRRKTIIQVINIFNKFKCYINKQNLHKIYKSFGIKDSLNKINTKYNINIHKIALTLQILPLPHSFRFHKWHCNQTTTKNPDSAQQI